MTATRNLARNALVTAVAVTLTATGCSSSKSKSSPAAGSQRGGTTVAVPHGSPFVGYSVVNSETAADNEAGIVAATRAINASGGIDGHPIQVRTCDDNATSATAATCARTAISDPSVLAMVNISSTFGSVYDPLINQARIANIAVEPYGPADETSPMSFPLTSAGLNTIAAAYAGVTILGDKRIGVPYIALPAGAVLPPFAEQLIKPVGGTVVGAVAIPPSASDLTSFAASEVAAKPDLVVDGLPSTLYEDLIKAMQSQGAQTTYQISTGVFDSAQIQSQFGNSANIILSDEYDHGAPGYQSFLHDMATYNGRFGDHNDSALSGWMGVEAFAQALKALTAQGDASPTRSDIVNWLSSQTDFDVQGLSSGLNFTKPATGLGGTVPRVFSTKVWLSSVKDGKEVPMNGGKPVSLPGWS